MHDGVQVEVNRALKLLLNLQEYEVQHSGDETAKTENLNMYMINI